MQRQFLLIVLGFAIFVEPNALRNGYSVCYTDECYSLGNLILHSVNETFDPCTDFYNYACGSWPKNYPVPKGKLSWDLGAMITKQLQASLKEILQEEPNLEDSIPLSIEKKWFKSCMDEDRIERQNIEELSKIIENLGGWQLAMPFWEAGQYNTPWQNVIKGYMKLNVGNSLFVVGISPDAKNSSFQVITLDEPTTSNLHNHIFDKLFKSVNEVESKEGFHENKALEIIMRLPSFYANYTKKEIEPLSQLYRILSMIEFKTKLQMIKSSPEELEMGISESKMTINDFQEYYDSNRPHYNSKINWLEIFQILMEGSGIYIDGSEQIVVNNKQYFDKLFTVLDETSSNSIANYLHWNFLLSSLVYFNKESRELLAEFSELRTGITKSEKERSTECLENLRIKHGVTRRILEQYFPINILTSARNLAEDIRKEIGNDIVRASWMDKNTKLLALEKLDTMEVKIGYPKFYENGEMFNTYYDGFQVEPDYFNNVMNFMKYGKIKMMKNLRKPFDKDQWFMTPLTMNAYYFPPTNSLTIPAAQLVVPTYSLEIPMAAQYGSVGFIIGHEMSHGFDITGRQFDKNGNLIPWWPSQVVTDFKTRADCFVRQYEYYGVNGQLTQSENIADSSGLNAAFEAFTKKAEGVKEIRLPNLEHVNGNQLFFLSFANTFCHSTTPYFDKQSSKDVHTKMSLRINGAVANVKGFAEAFQCSESSPLNIFEKCVIW